MIEHDPWVGVNYKTGINGQRIAIVGFSHHNDEEIEKDSARSTKETIEGIITGKFNFVFYTHIRNYIGFDNNEKFWNRVMFFNYLPNSVPDDDIYSYGSEEQHKRAKDRFLRLMREYLPHKVLVFTVKGWESFPLTREEEIEGGVCQKLGPQFPMFAYGTYDANGQIVKAFGLRHPLGANGELMRRVVQHILAIPIQ